MANPSSPCETCNKSTLSMVLLRPSPVALAPGLVPLGAEKVACDATDTSGLLPKRVPVKSRFALRFLRAGYVHVFMPAPPKGVRNWHSYRVTELADLYPDSQPLFIPVGEDKACSTKGHNRTGMRLLEIPQAHLVKDIWIAYSANQWSDKLRAKNAANPDAMQHVSLSGGSPNTFKPTQASLRAKVLECALPTLQIGDAKEHDFAFNSVSAEVDALVHNLQTAAACHPATKGKELAIVLRDPVGIATELNAWRLRKQELIQKDIAAERAKPENEHPLQSSDALLTLKQVIVDSNLAEADGRVKNKVMTKARFEEVKRAEGGMAVYTYQQGLPYWVPLDDTPENIKAYGPGMGVRMVPGHEHDLENRAYSGARDTWKKMESKYYNEDKRQQWVDSFEKRMQSQYVDQVTAWEEDWWGMRADKQFANYFELHFDESDANDPDARYSPGVTYAAEVSRALTPAPAANSAVLDAYAQELMKQPTDSTALLWRALVANQKELLPAVAAMADTPVAASGAFPGRRGEGSGKAGETPQVSATLGGALVKLNADRFDKLYDFGKNIIGLTLEAKNPNAIQRAVKEKYKWVTVAWGDKMSLYSLSVWMSVGAVAGAVTTLRVARWGAGTDAGKKLIDRALHVGMVQHTIDSVQKWRNQGGGKFLAVPMLIGVTYPVEEARARLSGRGAGVASLPLARNVVGGTVTMYLLTDADELAKYNGELKTAIEKGAGKLAWGADGAMALKAVPGARPMVIARETFETIWKTRNATLGTAETLFGTLDGRLAVGGLLVNVFAIKKSLGEVKEAQETVEKTLDSPETQRKLTTATLGLLDAFGGTLGAALEMYQVVAKEFVVKGARKTAIAAGATVEAADEAAEAAVKVSASLARLRIGGAFFGCMGGAFATVGAFRNAQDAATYGQRDVALLYWGSFIAFSGATTTSALLGYGAIADALLKSQARGAVGRMVVRVVGEDTLGRVAAQLGVEAGAELIGLSIPGIGWLCLGVALGFEVLAVMNTPTALQLWVSRSYFGKSTGADPDHAPFPHGQWKLENDALKKLFAPAVKVEGGKSEHEGEKK